MNVCKIKKERVPLYRKVEIGMDGGFRESPFFVF